jgi:hypothetical protein
MSAPIDQHDQWTAGARLITALDYGDLQPDTVPRPAARRIVDLVGRRQFDRIAEDVWHGIAGICAQVRSQPLTFGECARVLLLEWAFEEPMTAAGSKRKQRLIGGDPVVLTTVLTAFAHACLLRASPAERRAILAGIAAAAAAESTPDA